MSCPGSMPVVETGACVTKCRDTGEGKGDRQRAALLTGSGSPCDELRACVTLWRHTGAHVVTRAAPRKARLDGMIDGETGVPSRLRHESFVAVPLIAGLAALDHACYMASPDVIRVHSDGRWPIDGFTLADDRALVALHEADHESGRAFTFALLDPSQSEALGCMYINPLRDYLVRAQAAQELVDEVPPASAMVTFWLRQDQQDTGLAERVVEAVHLWLDDDWPLASHVFRVLPGERSSCAALDRLGLHGRQLDLPGDPRPYLWYSAGPV